jgi:hypothetical protein
MEVKKMSRMSTIALLCGLFLAALLVTAGCTMTPGGKPTPTPVPTSLPTPVPVETTGPAACGLTSCHGMDLACGTNPPEVCTMEYRIGDRCRAQASCDTSGGGCTLVAGPKFTACKTCVEQCMIAAGPDSLAAFSCEEKC